MLPAVGVWLTEVVPQPSLTVAEAVKSASVDWQFASAATVALAGQEIVGGAHEAFTATVNEQLAVRPASSVAVIVTV